MTEHTRTLDFKIAFAMGLGTMIAAGIFSLSGTAVLRIGSTAVVAFVLAALVAGVTAATYSEFASIYAENGGGYLFSSRTFEGKDLLTYGIGMSLFLGYTGTTAFYLATMDEWFMRFLVPESVQFLPAGTFGVLAAVLLGALNARGTEESGTFQLLVTSAKVVVLLVFIAGMFVSVGVGPAFSNFAADFQVEPVNTLSVASLAFITFFGFSAIAASAGEIIEPRKTVPRAIAASIGTVTVLYAFVIVAMVNIGGVADRLTRTPEEILQLGETAMGAVAQAFIPLTVAGVPVGKYLIVAGAIFSMVSASNASILAATSIGSLMGKQGQAPRPFSRIHPTYGTPMWSVTTATAVIAGLVLVFMTLFGHHGYLAPVHLGLSFSLPVVGTVAVEEFVLGLNPLTGFATLNLLLPLGVVNYALVRNRAKFPDIERGFSVPGVPWVPAVGIVANVALIYNLPVVGVGVGLFAVGVLLLAYVSWGGNPGVDELVQQVEKPTGTGAENSHDHRVLVSVARPSRAPRYVRLAERITEAENPLIQVLTVTEVPEQTPYELVGDVASERTERIRDALDDADLEADCTVEGRTCRDVAFAITQAAREADVDRIVMGYPEEHPDITEAVEYSAPCDMVFASGLPEAFDLETVNVGAGGGPHHEGLLPLVGHLGRTGELHVIHVTPEAGGTEEGVASTVDRLGDVDCEVHRVSAHTVAEGLVETAAENGGILIVGASRDRSLRQWVFGSTPDNVIRRAREADVPVLVYASETGVPERIEDRVFPVYRYVQKLRSGSTARIRGN